MIGIVFILRAHLFTYSCLLKKYPWEKPRWILKIVLYTIFPFATVASVVYFLTILIFFITLGNFHNFEEVENLTLPTIIALLSPLTFKPSYDYFKKQFESRIGMQENEYTQMK